MPNGLALLAPPLAWLIGQVIGLTATGIGVSPFILIGTIGGVIITLLVTWFGISVFGLTSKIIAKQLGRVTVLMLLGGLVGGFTGLLLWLFGCAFQPTSFLGQTLGCYDTSSLIWKLGAGIGSLVGLIGSNSLMLLEFWRLRRQSFSEDAVAVSVSNSRLSSSKPTEGKPPDVSIGSVYPVNRSTILFLSADPTDATRLRLGEEFREIKDNLRKSKLRGAFNLALPQLSLRPSDISQALLDESPRIVHFSGHGTSSGELCFEDAQGKIKVVDGDALAALFELVASDVECVILNACYSSIQAQEINRYIDYVIGMNRAIGDKAALSFSVGFYQALGAGRTVEDAYRFGCVQIRLQSIPEHLTPVLLKGPT